MVLRLGYVPDQKDIRDKRIMAVSLGRVGALPPEYDNGNGIIEKYDQGNANSCVGNSGSALFEYDDVKQGGSNIKPSRLAAYYLARAQDGWESFDGGASIRSCIKAFVEIGMVQEKDWPYDLSKVNVAPPSSAIQTAALHRALVYARIDQNNGALKSCLADKFLFIFGMSLYQNFQSSKTLSTGIVDLPSGSMIGGHAMLGVGYKDDGSMYPDRLPRYKCFNPWGPQYGDKGFWYIPYQMIEDPNMTSDIWTIRSVNDPDVITPEPPKPIEPPKPNPPIVVTPDPKPKPKPDPTPDPNPKPTPAKRHFAGFIQRVKGAGGVIVTPTTNDDAKTAAGMGNTLVDVIER